MATQKEMSSAEQMIFGRYISSRDELHNSLIALLLNQQQSTDEALFQEALEQGLK